MGVRGLDVAQTKQWLIQVSGAMDNGFQRLEHGDDVVTLPDVAAKGDATSTRRNDTARHL